MTADPTAVTVVVPLLDDKDGIAACLDAIVAQESHVSRIEQILVADGGSTDGSRDEVSTRAAADPRIVLVENPDRFVPSGLNRALALSTSPVIVRVDSHAVLAPDYVDRAVTTLQRTGADVVGGPMRPRGDSPVGDAVAWALCSRWGIGGSRFHLEGAEGETDAVYMGVFRRDTFARFGTFDERFARNQDDEFTYRVREAGGRVWLDPGLRSTYTPRSSFRALWRQFRGYGRFKPLVLRTHPSGLRLRHLAPPVVAATWAILPLAVLSPWFAAPALAHLAAIGLAARPGAPGWGCRARALWTMHLGYGFGFLQGLIGPPRV